MKTDSTPKQHARFAASSSDRWLACPGSIEASESAPEQEETEASEEGTRAHTLMEFALSGGIKDVVKFFENDADLYPLEMREYVQDFVDWVRSQMKPHYELLIEERVSLDGVITEDADPVVPVAFGTVDVAIIEPFGCLHIIDFKYGKKHVPHEDNSQMIYYALGLAHKLKYDIDKVKTTIYQPRSVSKKHPARTYTFGLEKLEKWKKIFSEGVKVASKKNAPRESGEHCFFCAAKINCPAIYKKSFEKAKLDFSSPVQPSPKSLTSDQLKTFLDKAAYLKLWIKEVESYAEKKLKAGETIQGWTLVPTRPTRKWKDENAVKDADTWGELTVESLVSPAEAEKVLKKKKWSKEEIDQFLNTHVHSVSSGVKLAQSNTNRDYNDSGLDDLIID